MLFLWTLTAVLSCQAVNRIVSFSFTAHVARKGIGTEAVGQATVFVDVSNIDLDRGMILGSDQAVGGRAFFYIFKSESAHDK